MNGAALLLLRMAVGGTSIMQGLSFLQVSEHVGAIAPTTGLALCAGGLLLLPGFITPFGCFSTFTINCALAAGLLPSVPNDLFGAKVTLVLLVVMTADLFLLGPGAYSLDARIFGRREIIIPHHERAPE